MSRRICVLALVAVCVAVASANPFFLGGGGKGGKGNSGGGDSYGAPAQSYGATTSKPSYNNNNGKSWICYYTSKQGHASGLECLDVGWNDLNLGQSKPDE